MLKHYFLTFSLMLVFLCSGQNEFILEKGYFSQGSIEKLDSTYLLYGLHNSKLEIIHLNPDFSIAERKFIGKLENSDYVFAKKEFQNQLSFSFHGKNRGYILLDSTFNIIESETWTRRSENLMLLDNKKYIDPNYSFGVYEFLFTPSSFLDQTLKLIASENDVTVGFYSKQEKYKYETRIKTNEVKIFSGNYENAFMLADENESPFVVIRKNDNSESIFSFSKSNKEINFQYNLDTTSTSFETVSDIIYNEEGNIVILGNTLNKESMSSVNFFIKIINTEGKLLRYLKIPTIDLPSIKKEQNQKYYYACRFVKCLKNEELEVLIEIIAKEKSNTLNSQTTSTGSVNIIGSLNYIFKTNGYALYRIANNQIISESIYELDKKIIAHPPAFENNNYSFYDQIIGDDKSFSHFDPITTNLLFKINTTSTRNKVYAIFNFQNKKVKMLDEIKTRTDNDKFILMENGCYLYSTWHAKKGMSITLIKD